MKAHFYRLIIPAMLVIISFACNTDDDSDDSNGDTASADPVEDDFDVDAVDIDTDSPAESVESVGCKASGKSSDSEIEETIALSYSGGVLAVTHVNACRECFWQPEVVYGIENFTVMIVEGDLSEYVAMCACPFDVSYAIPGVVPGTYRLIVKTKDGPMGDERSILAQIVELADGDEYSFLIRRAECG